MKRIQYLYPLLGLLLIGIVFYPTIHHDAIYWTGGKNLSDMPTIPWLSLSLHLFNALIVYFLVLILFKKPVIAAVAMVLWGLHPMHADSVAWILRQGNLAHTLLYMLALLSYLFYIRENKNQKKYIFYVLSCLTFVGASVFQRIALVIPLTFFLLDYYENRSKIKYEWWLDKLPFFALTILSWFISLNANSPSYALDITLPFWQKLWLGGYALGIYISNFIAPLHLTLINPVEIDKPTLLIGAAITVTTLALVIVAVIRKKTPINQEFTFSILFFLIHLLPALIVPMDGYLSWIAYMSYLPYLGLILAMIYLYLFLQRSNILWLNMVVITIVAIALGSLAYQRSNEWKSTKLLLTQVIQKYPQNDIAYFLRGNLLLRDKKYQSAMADFEKVNSIKPDVISTFLLGHIFLKLRDYKTSTIAYEKSRAAQPSLANTFRYLIDMSQNKSHLDAPVEARELLKQAEPMISNNQMKAEWHFAYGLHHTIYLIYDKALESYKEAIKYDPTLVDAYTNIGTILLFTRKTDEAITYLRRAETLAPSDTIVLGNLAGCYAAKKDTITANYYAQRYNMFTTKKK